MRDFFKSVKVQLMDTYSAKKFMEFYHYTHTCPKCTIAYQFTYNNELVCVIVYGQPSGKYLASSIWDGGTEDQCLELLRLFSFDKYPKNTESFCIAKSVKLLQIHKPHVKVLVSYADCGAGHVGYIYQACNWLYIGNSSSETKIFIDGRREHRRSLYDKYGTSSIAKLKKLLGVRLEVSSDKFLKNKYIYYKA